MDIKKLDPRHLDALKEVSNIGAGHAATALSELAQQIILIDVPVIEVKPLGEALTALALPGQKIACVTVGISGDITGESLLLFTERDAMEFANRVLGRVESIKPVSLGQLEESALKETSNIMTCAYMNALGELLGVMVIPTAPRLEIRDPRDAGGQSFSSHQEHWDMVISIKNEFRFMDKQIKLQGYFLLIPDGESLKAIFKKLNM
ncbi:chemotaxis protein CheC [candidate division TA06 bacterium]|uniref:Chemotaxis protein CheC n=1 Tax=candidate division TA06 bacterium TaxID=2250710 RepID=A0A933IAU3_UNCT6|nr:chemotaxis protein CheC [candidate division TA06 bacterium]